MKETTFPRVAALTLEQMVQRSHKKELRNAFLLLLLTAGIVHHWYQRFFPQYPWYGLIGFAIALLWLWLQSDLPQGVPVDNAPKDQLGEYTPEQIKQLVAEVCRSYKEHEIPNIYIIDTMEGQAAVVNVDGLNFIKPWNAVYLSPYILYNLDPDELKSVLAHEMCHFSKHYTIWDRFFYIKIPIFAFWIMALLNYPIDWFYNWVQGETRGFWYYVWWVIALSFFSFVWKVVMFLVSIVATLIVRGDEQAIESLCDYEASNRYGVLPTVNALLKIGSRQEIINAVVAQFSPHETKPETSQTELEASLHPAKESTEGASESDQEVKIKHVDHNTKAEDEEVSLEFNRMAAMRIALTELENLLTPKFISLEEAQDIIEAAVQKGLEETTAQRYQHKKRKLLRWQAFDNIFVNQKLEAEEYTNFIDALKSNPSKPLFYLAEEIDEEVADEDVHPPLSKRILFLEYNREHGALSL